MPDERSANQPTLRLRRNVESIELVALQRQNTSDVRNAVVEQRLVGISKDAMVSVNRFMIRLAVRSAHHEARARLGS